MTRCQCLDMGLGLATLTRISSTPGPILGARFYIDGSLLLSVTPLYQELDCASIGICVYVKMHCVHV